MGVDDILDLAVSAARDTFGRAVTYTPAGGDEGDAVELTGVYEAHDRFVAQDFGGLETGLPRLKLRTADLEEEELTPAQGDSVAFEVREVERTYQVVRVEKPDQGWTVLHLMLGVDGGAQVEP